MLKRLLLLGTFMLSTFILTQSPAASAHFLLQDTSTGIGASFHCAPDHDPIAGQESIISYDFSKAEKVIDTDSYNFSLTIKDEKDKIQNVPFDINSGLIAAQHMFPYQGLYTIRLEIQPKTGPEKASILEYKQRVSRGTVAPKSSQSNVLIFAGLGLVVALTVVLIIREVRS